MDSRKSALIVAQSAQIRDSLLVLLRATPQIETIHQAEDSHSALALGSDIQPALGVLDYNSTPDQLASDLINLRVAWPQARYLVLLDDEQDRRHVQSAGADVALVKGIRAATILEIIEGLLADEEPATLGGRS
jgi:DNA-binding NarL/FixJ family response regulator